MSLLFCLIERHFAMHFYVPIHFLKVPFDFASLPRAEFGKAKSHRGTPKGGKCHFFFSLIERHFFVHFYVPFNFFKVPFDSSWLAKAAFCKAKANRGTPKGGKMSLLFFSKRMAFFHAFLEAISFFQSQFRSCLPFKSSILQR